jgi:hypothetical protein
MMEIKIGIQHVAREVTLESAESAEAVESHLREALADGGLLTLTDVKGRRVLVPVTNLAYVDLGLANARPVGFGAV